MREMFRFHKGSAVYIIHPEQYSARLSDQRIDLIPLGATTPAHTIHEQHYPDLFAALSWWYLERNSFDIVQRHKWTLKKGRDT